MGKKLGQADDPLLVSVRSGAAASMPGMMETVLNVGLNDESVQGLAAAVRQRALRLGLLPAPAVDVRPDGARHRRGPLRGGAGAPQGEGRCRGRPRARRRRPRGPGARTYQEIIEEQSGRPFPQDPREQLDLAVLAVFGSWNTERAILYRRQERIPSDLGTAVNVCSMVFGNLGTTPAPGWPSPATPPPARRASTATTCRTRRARTWSRASATPCRWPTSRASTRPPTTSCSAIMQRLEEHYLDLCDIEFTIERGKLWMLQTRVGKRTPGAAFRIAGQLVDQGLIDLDEALHRVTGAQLAQLMFPQFDPAARARAAHQGHERLAGRRGRQGGLRLRDRGGVGRAGEKVILVRRETTPDDLHGMVAATGVLTSRGGKTSHAAVVARGMGRTCVCGADALDVDVRAGHFSAAGRRRHRGGRPDLDRRHHRRGVPRRGPGRWTPSWCAGSRATSRVGDDLVGGGGAADGARRRRTPPGGARQRRQPRRRPAARAGSGRRASACAAPSTCSWASGASWSST